MIISTSSHCCLVGVFVFYVDDYEFWGLKSIDTWFYFSSFLKWRCFAGLAFPQLYFYNGGVKEFLATIKQHVFIVRLATDLVCNSFYFEILFLYLFLSIYKYLHYKDAYLDIIRASLIY